MWVAGEAARARFPFGGFPWGKVAFVQPDGVFLPLVSIGGTPLLSFAVALCGFGLGSLGSGTLTLRRPRGTDRERPRQLPSATLAAVLPVLAALTARPLLDSAINAPLVTVAAVQGNVPRIGLDFNAQRRAVLDNHVRRTRQLAADVRASRLPRLDLVIWPENSSDIDPYRNPDAAAEITDAFDELGVPVLVGAVVTPASGGPLNTAIVWQPRQGPSNHYVKRRLQPFGETIPLRSLVRRLNSDVDRVRQDFQPGTDPAPLLLSQVSVGVTTCYEVAFDTTVSDTVRAGAQLLAVPTNNATFGRTEMTYQQLAMSGVRAVEHDRAVVIAATSGVSAIMTPDGQVVASTGLFTPAALVQRVPLRSTTTLATRLGTAPEWLLTGLGLAALASGLASRRRPNRRLPA